MSENYQSVAINEEICSFPFRREKS